jgi:NAD(P) transhydrogenase subunit alpha
LYVDDCVTSNSFSWHLRCVALVIVLFVAQQFCKQKFTYCFLGCEWKAFRQLAERFGGASMLNWITANQQMIYIVILMIFIGIEVIGRVPSVLHTPLMSGANAIHGVVIIGAIIVMGKAETDNYLALILGFLAVILGTLNVVGGFVVTDRMLEMFKKKKPPKSSA